MLATAILGSGPFDKLARTLAVCHPFPKPAFLGNSRHIGSYFSRLRAMNMRMARTTKGNEIHQSIVGRVPVEMMHDQIAPLLNIGLSALLASISITLKHGLAIAIIAMAITSTLCAKLGAGFAIPAVAVTRKRDIALRADFVHNSPFIISIPQ